MMTIIHDCESVVRAQIAQDVLKEFLLEDGVDFHTQCLQLSKREGVVVCFRNKVRIKRMSGVGWYQISGYREDGQDLALAVFNLHKAERAVAKRKARQLEGSAVALAMANAQPTAAVL